MDDVDAVVNLSGASLARLPWTPALPARDRRLPHDGDAHARRCDAHGRDARPRSSSAPRPSAIYGDRPGELLTESSSAGSGFLADVVDALGEGRARSPPTSTRVVTLRTGIVVGHGGAHAAHRHAHAARPRRAASAPAGSTGRGSRSTTRSRPSAPAHLEAVGAREPRRPDAGDRRPGHDARSRRADAPALPVPVPERMLGLALGRAADDLLLAEPEGAPAAAASTTASASSTTTVESAVDAMLSGPRARA